MRITLLFLWSSHKNVQCSCFGFVFISFSFSTNLILIPINAFYLLALLWKTSLSRRGEKNKQTKTLLISTPWKTPSQQQQQPKTCLSSSKPDTVSVSGDPLINCSWSQETLGFSHTDSRHLVVEVQGHPGHSTGTLLLGPVLTSRVLLKLRLCLICAQLSRYFWLSSTPIYSSFLSHCCDQMPDRR